MTRSLTEVPDKLYNLEIRQYEPNGNYIAGTGVEYANVEEGTYLNVTLAERSDCQLVLVARGSGGAVTALGNKSLSDVLNMVVNSSVINAIDPNVTGSINSMPYVLHLEHVKVTTVNGTPVIQSPEGSYDTRLLLKRLATRLTVNWEYNVSGYKLKQLLLQSVPLNYAIVDKPESDGTYPSLVSQFTTLVATITDANAASGSYSWWIPANVRGESAAATSDLQRIKANAPTGSAFLNFVAGNTTDSKKKLDYRVYIGSGASTDFNVYRNKNYAYTVNFNHVGVPTDDGRVTYIDPIPASENNDNLVPTANCFMIAPGGAFCFDPFAFQVDGNPDNNSILSEWSDREGGIVYVKLYWQTRENGDVGDPVMGVVNIDNEDVALSDHINIVDAKHLDGSPVSAINPLTTTNGGRIYCRVASNTSGGNGMIVAYNAAKEIIWSWHVWVTDYHPDATGNTTVLEAGKRKLRYSYNNENWNVLPMMDRNLGAMAGYVNQVPATMIDKSKANGLHFHWGRKDPFPSTYTTRSDNTINIPLDSDQPTNGLQNYYMPNGYTYFRNNYVSENTYRNLTKTPASFGGVTDYTVNSWTTVNDKKAIWDPCPAGWRIASYKDYASLFASGKVNEGHPVINGGEIYSHNTANLASVHSDGGFAVYFEAKGSGSTCYYRLTGYRRTETTFEFIGQVCSIWCRDAEQINNNMPCLRVQSNSNGRYQSFFVRTMSRSDVHTLRCVQERE